MHAPLASVASEAAQVEGEMEIERESQIERERKRDKREFSASSVRCLLRLEGRFLSGIFLSRKNSSDRDRAIERECETESEHNGAHTISTLS